MADIVTVSCDPTELLARLDGTTLVQALHPFIKSASRISADSIASEARARLSRQLSGTSTGATVAGIRVKSSGNGWVVISGNLTTGRLPYWLEHGTQHMRPRSYFDSSAALEEGAHRRRIEAAIQAGLSEYGLGDQG